MKNELALLWIRELLWWVFTALLAALLLFPCYGIISNKLLLNNAGLAVAAITMFRYTVFLQQVPYLRHLYARVVLLVVVGFAFFQFLRVVQDFLFIIDNYTISTFLRDEIMFQTNEAINKAYLYFKQEYLFLCVTLLILSVVLMFRLVGSVWKLGRDYNFDRKPKPGLSPDEQN